MSIMFRLQLLSCVFLFLVVTQGNLRKLRSAGKQMSIPWTNCGTEEDILTIKDIRFDPYPLQLGHNFDLHIEGILSDQVSSGSTAKVKLTWSSEYSKIILVNETLNLCDLMADMGISCPLSKHTVLMAHYHDHFPSIFPKGFYAVKMEAKNQNKREIFCVQTNMTIDHAKN